MGAKNLILQQHHTSIIGEDPVLRVIEKPMTIDQLPVPAGNHVTEILDRVHRQSASAPCQAPTRRTSVARLRQRREDSIGEEVELEDEESGDSPELYKQSCSPPRWFNV